MSQGIAIKALTVVYKIQDPESAQTKELVEAVQSKVFVPPDFDQPYFVTSLGFTDELKKLRLIQDALDMASDNVNFTHLIAEIMALDDGEISNIKGVDEFGGFIFYPKSEAPKVAP